ncbi:hypothetical protein B0H17DRAFT_1219121 [Mycena rosella]|uniref:Uncharacterized protein n=1 Tax=Mycena rosella TaxID=1033263 RepID=A0AAD7BJN4_MYCRO|nr:hypothetical protein B0H17DRAFT_1219121 [Mycena rosella]
MSASQLGRCCDGDDEAWRRPIGCPFHPPASSPTYLYRVPVSPELCDTMGRTIGYTLDFILDMLDLSPDEPSVPAKARGLLKMMFVPDLRKRASLAGVTHHPWLVAYHLPAELERAAMEQQQLKCLAYWRQMRTSHTQPQNAQPEFLYDSAEGMGAGAEAGVGGVFGGDDNNPIGPPPGTAMRRTAAVLESPRKGRDAAAESPWKGKEKEVESSVRGRAFVTTPTTATVLSPIVTTTLAGGRKADAGPTSAEMPTGPPSVSATVTPSFASRFRRSINVGGVSMSSTSKAQREAAPAAPTSAGGVLRIHDHDGAAAPGDVKEVLVWMGIEIHFESEYKFRCIRVKQRRSGKATIGSTVGSQGVAASTMVCSAGSNGVRRQVRLPLPSQLSFSGGGMLRGLLMRRQLSQVSSGFAGAGLASFDGDESLNNSRILSAEPVAQADTLYGVSPEEVGDKGNLRSYKFLYDMLRKRADLQNQR